MSSRDFLLQKLLTGLHYQSYAADKEIKELLEKKRSCNNHLLAKPDDRTAKAAYKTAYSTLQAKLRIVQKHSMIVIPFLCRNSVNYCT